MTALADINTAVEVYAWQALESPQVGEMIYRRGPMLVFAQYDKAGTLRSATLRRVIGANLTTEVANVGWNDGVKAWHVTRWLKEYGETAAEARDAARRRRARG